MDAAAHGLGGVRLAVDDVTHLRRMRRPGACHRLKPATGTAISERGPHLG